MEHTLEWELTNFYSLYDRKTIVTPDGVATNKPVPVLRRPYPSSPIFTTDFGAVKAQWMIRLISERTVRRRLVPGATATAEADKDCWSFQLDLVGTEVKSKNNNNSPPPPKRRIGTAAAGGQEVQIKAKCQLFLEMTGVRDDDGETIVDSTALESFIFGPNNQTMELGWPNYSQQEDRDVIVDFQKDGVYNRAEHIVDHYWSWRSRRNDILRVRVNIKCIWIKKNPPTSKPCSSTETLNANLIRDLGRMLHSGQNADVVIKCGPNSVKFPVHKSILSSRSPVFRAMFKAGMMESTSKIVKLEDMESSVMKLFLEFLYTANVDLNNNNMDQDQVIDLITAADKYEVTDLKEFCFQHLVSKLSEETSGKLAVAAYLHGANTRIKDVIYEYNAEHWRILGAKEEFSALVKAYPAAFVKN